MNVTGFIDVDRTDAVMRKTLLRRNEIIKAQSKLIAELIKVNAELRCIIDGIVLDAEACSSGTAEETELIL